MRHGIPYGIDSMVTPFSDFGESLVLLYIGVSKYYSNIFESDGSPILTYDTFIKR